MTLLFKLIHIAAISVWMGALLALPLLYLRRNVTSGSGPLNRLHRAVRWVYIHIASPAALVAIISGITLAFLENTFVPWFAAKLAFVAMLTGLHVYTVSLQLRLFDPGATYRPARAVAAMLSVGVAATAVLALVLAKPQISMPGLEELFRPGGLAAAVPLLNHLLPLP